MRARIARAAFRHALQSGGSDRMSGEINHLRRQFVGSMAAVAAVQLVRVGSAKETSIDSWSST
jgi:hypothetical protein